MSVGNNQDILKYESIVWKIADLLIGAGIKQSDIKVEDLLKQFVKESMEEFTDKKKEKLNEWNEVKKRTEDKEVIATFKERNIYWANVGENIGFEQNGKGDSFMRPLLIFKKFSNNMFFGIPLSTSKKEGSWFFEFSFKDNKISTALIVQGKIFDVKRLDEKIGKISIEDFARLKVKFKELFNV